MKRYFVGLVAITIAIGFSAFSLKNKYRTAKRIFSYSGTYSSASVANPANWTYVEEYSEFSSLCSSTDRACKVIIEEAYTKSAGASYAMRSSTDGAPYVILATTRQDPTNYPSIYKVTSSGSTGIATNVPENAKVTSSPF